MKIKEILSSFVALFICLSINAQKPKYYTPLEIAKAYENGTRSLDGKPGEKYWQNTADYAIRVELDTENYKISGAEQVVYYNNSTDTLKTLVVRLYANAFKKGVSRRYSLNGIDVHNGVELKQLSINGEAYDLKDKHLFKERGTVASIRLKEPLVPGSKLLMDCEWHQAVPKVSTIRIGATDSTAFFIGYFYPQISVYDDIFGWDQYDYNLQTEFYNNLANFDVKVTVPDNYLVVGTGTLQNAIEVLPKRNYKKFLQAMKSDTAIAIISTKEVNDGFKVKSNIWHYKATEVTDFAFCTSNIHAWAGANQVIGDCNVFIGSIYPVKGNVNYAEHISIQQKIMLHFSQDIPGIPYPYEAFSSYINGTSRGGMEFPMLANNGSDDLMVTIHEMFHTYFPMYVRCNEKLWAWMDEGWAVYNTLMVENKFFKNKTHSTDFVNNGKYMRINGKITDLPLITPSQFISGSSYFGLSYATSATVKTILNHYLGDEVFLKCYRAFITRWAKKSPSPYDFFYTFEDVSGEDLSWLLKPWFFEFGYADVAIASFENDTLVIANNGVKPVPVFVELKYLDGNTKEMEYNAGVWKNGNKEFEIDISDADMVKSIYINRTIVDAHPQDNKYIR